MFKFNPALKILTCVTLDELFSLVSESPFLYLQNGNHNNDTCLL